MKKILFAAVLALGVAAGTGCATVGKAAESGEKIVSVGGKIAPTIFDALGSIFGIIGGAVKDVQSITDPAKDAVGLPTSEPVPAPTAPTTTNP